MVKNKLNRLIRPHMGLYFAAMGAFSAVAMLMEQYWLGATMGAAVLLMYALYQVDRNFRNRQLH